jgi:hypothetical protein
MPRYCSIKAKSALYERPKQRRLRYLARVFQRSTNLIRITASCVALSLAACGSTVSMYGTADEVWQDTIDVLRMQGAMPAEIPLGLERPRLDRAAGEIDVPYAESVYYGQGAAFLQVDVSDPLSLRKRSIRMWVDYPVGMKVVRYGRAINDETTALFKATFEKNLDTLLRDREAAVSATTNEPAPSLAPPAPTTTPINPAVSPEKPQS